MGWPLGGACDLYEAEAMFCLERDEDSCQGIFAILPYLLAVQVRPLQVIGFITAVAGSSVSLASSLAGFHRRPSPL